MYVFHGSIASNLYSMKYNDFNIEFVTDQMQSKHARGEECKYEAIITVLSKGFQLFKVSNIRRASEGGVITLSGSYYLTSYPIRNDRDSRWIDPVTLQTNSFLNVVGGMIDQYLTRDKIGSLN